MGKKKERKKEGKRNRGGNGKGIAEEKLGKEREGMVLKKVREWKHKERKKEEKRNSGGMGRG